MSTIKLFALDTNILIYLHDIEAHSKKRQIPYELIGQNPYVSAQVISEYLNVCFKKLKMPKDNSLKALMQWLPFCNLTPYNTNIHIKAQSLIERYDFQLFDSIVVSSALLSGCSVLYSEDMQHDLMVEKQLKIVNPFL